MTKKILMIDGFSVNVEKRKNVKNIYLKVTKPNAEIKVVAPYRTTDKYIVGFVEKNLSEVKKLIEKYSSVEKIEYKNFERHLLWGKEYLLLILPSSKNKVSIHNENIILETVDVEDFKLKEKLMNDFYRNELNNELPEIFFEKLKVMNLSINEYRIKNMKTRWGTCNITDKRIWINLQLAKKPKVCVEYVVIHELAHLIEKNHTKVFYEVVEKYMPAYRSVELLLKN